jgi:hypothetical protein
LARCFSATPPFSRAFNQSGPSPIKRKPPCPTPAAAIGLAAICC